MPNIESAAKRMRQNRKKRLANRSKSARMRSHIRKFRHLIEQGEQEEARSLLPLVYSVIDKTAQKGVIHRNTASRYKSRLARQLD